MFVKFHRRMTPGEIGRDLRAKGFTPAFVDDEPRIYLGFFGGGLDRVYIEDYL